MFNTETFHGSRVPQNTHPMHCCMSITDSQSVQGRSLPPKRKSRYRFAPGPSSVHFFRFTFICSQLSSRGKSTGGMRIVNSMQFRASPTPVPNSFLQTILLAGLIVNVRNLIAVNSFGPRGASLTLLSSMSPPTRESQLWPSPNRESQTPLEVRHNRCLRLPSDLLIHPVQDVSVGHLDHVRIAGHEGRFLPCPFLCESPLECDLLLLLRRKIRDTRANPPPHRHPQGHYEDTARNLSPDALPTTTRIGLPSASIPTLNRDRSHFWPLTVFALSAEEFTPTKKPSSHLLNPTSLMQHKVKKNRADNSKKRSWAMPLPNGSRSCVNTRWDDSHPPSPSGRSFARVAVSRYDGSLRCRSPSNSLVKLA